MLQRQLRAKDLRIEALNRELGAKCGVVPRAGGDIGGAPELVRAMDEWADDACACTDVKCASDVGDRMAPRVESLQQSEASPTDGDRKLMARAAERVASCGAKLTKAAMESMSHGQIHIETVPAGARVREGSVDVCLATPCDVSYGTDDASARAPHRLEFSKVGFANEIRTVRVVDGPVTVRLLKTE